MARVWLVEADRQPTTSFAHGWLVVDVLKAPEGPVDIGNGPVNQAGFVYLCEFFCDGILAICDFP